MTTTKLLITEMTASQSQKHVTFNEALFTLDNLVQLSVLDKDLTAPPGSPTTGDTYIVGSLATGSWLGKDAQVASYDGYGWIFFPPNDGWFCWVDDEAEIYFYNAGWTALGDVLGAGYLSLGGGTLTGNLVLEEVSPSIRFNNTGIVGYTLLQTNGATYEISVDAENNDAGSKFHVLIDGNSKFEVNEFGVGIGGASADATNGFSFFGTNALFNSSASLAQVFNKNLANNDASFAFQQGFLTYAQFGLLGNNDFTLKVGTGATIALVADETTGAIELIQHPKFSAYVSYDVYIAADTWTTVPCNNARHNDQGAFDSTINNNFTAPHAGYYTFGAGFTFKANAAAPTEIRVGLSINGAAPTEDRAITFADSYAFTISLKTSIQITALLKLSAGDTVEMLAYLGTNDGYVEANSNHFWGHQVP